MTAQLLSVSLAPAYGDSLERVDEIQLVEGHGLEGDRYAGSARQVTIVCTGEVRAAASLYGAPIDAFETRRNLVVDLDELPRTHGVRIAVGETELEVWRDCAPCEVMDEIFGDGAKESLRKRAGISAQVVKGGTIRVGDPVTVLSNE